MDFNVDLLILNVLDAPVDVKDGWFVIFTERIIQIVADQARLSYGCVAN
jgi:hypothetical protein